MGGEIISNNGNKGTNNGSAKLNKVKIDMIVELYLNDYSSKYICKKFNISNSTLMKLLRGDNWKGYINEEDLEKLKQKRNYWLKQSGYIGGPIGKVIIYKNKQYKTHKQLANYLGITPDTLCIRIKNNVPLDKKITTNKKIFYSGKIYKTLDECALDNNISKSSVCYRIRTGKAQYID